jgi:hypothetical protein
VPFNTNHKIQIVDASGDACDDDSGKLNVNATLVAGASIDIGDVEITGHSTITSFKNATIGTSAGQLTTNDQPCKHVDIMAAIANTGIIYVGGSSLTNSNGIALYPGDVYSIDIDNANNIYVLASEIGEDVAYVYYN